MNENAQEKIEKLLDQFDESTENFGPVLTKQQMDDIIPSDITKDDLTLGIPCILQKMNEFKTRITECDEKKKIWDEAKKTWTAKSKSLMELMERAMTNLHLSQHHLVLGKNRLSSSSRTVLEVDEQWLLDQYQTMLTQFQSCLPNYIIVKLDVDKTKLSAFVKEDPTMLNDNPEKIHYKQSVSTSIK